MTDLLIHVKESSWWSIFFFKNTPSNKVIDMLLVL
jgi:hypothetical protein